MVKILLAAGIDLDVNAEYGEAWTPLHKASEKGHVEVAKALLVASADVHARNKYDRTPLQVAALLGDTKVV